MTVTPLTPAEKPFDEMIAELRDRVDRMQGRPAAQPLAMHPALAGMLTLTSGGVYGVDAASLMHLLLAGPSGEGRWCGVIGMADFGAEAAQEAGVELSRLIVVPEADQQWLEVTAALIDVSTLVVVQPPAQVTSGDANRIAARLRDRGAALVVRGKWPRIDASLSLKDMSWRGIGQGAGRLVARRATISVQRGTTPAVTRTLWLPAEDLSVRPVESAPLLRPMRSVG